MPMSVSLKDRLSNWFGSRDVAARPMHGDQTERWVVVDVETSGLDQHTAQLLAVAAIAVQVRWQTGQLHILPGDSFEVDIRPTQLVSDKENILLHGIGQQRQQQGVELATALAQFLAFVGVSPLLAYHAWFDKALIKRHLAISASALTENGVQPQLNNPWVDIEKLCAANRGEKDFHALDDWLDHYNITCAVRHDAVSDTLAECELLQRIWPMVLQQLGREESWRGLEKLERMQRWLNR